MLFSAVALTGLTCIGAPFPHMLPLLHSLTVAGLIALAWWASWRGMSEASFASVIGFMAIHAIASRYSYSWVPYDDWFQFIVGISPTEDFDLTRNHFDRFVHLSFGILLMPLAFEVLRRQFDLREGVAVVVALLSITAIGAIYEILEWLVAVVFSPETAKYYNGQQGDFFDAQKDMALNLIGSILVAPLIRKYSWVFVQSARCAR